MYFIMYHATYIELSEFSCYCEYMSENQSQVSAVEKPEVPKPSLRSTIKEKFPKFRRYKEGKQEPREVLEDLNSERVTGLSAEMAADKTSFSLPDVFLPAQSQYDEFVNTLGSFDVQSEYQKLKQEMQDGRARYKAETPERQFTKTDHLRHKALEAAARAQGIKDIKGFNDLVNDFERRLTSWHQKNEHFDRMHLIVLAVKCHWFETVLNLPL